MLTQSRFYTIWGRGDNSGRRGSSQMTKYQLVLQQGRADEANFLFAWHSLLEKLLDQRWNIHWLTLFFMAMSKLIGGVGSVQAQLATETVLAWLTLPPLPRLGCWDESGLLFEWLWVRESKNLKAAWPKSFCLAIFCLESNLVDSASSHTLISKTKPCKSKYKSFTLKLRMAHYISYSLFDSPSLLG